MAVKVRLSEGVELVVDVKLPELLAALQAALDKGELLTIQQPDGEIVINPQKVLYLTNGKTARWDPSAPLTAVPAADPAVG
jgi:hypothetical protein